MASREEAAREIEGLSERLRRYEYEYHILNAPTVPDIEYDRLFDRLKELEGEHPELVRSDSPTQRIGSDLSNELPEVDHTIPVLSLDKAYSFDELMGWTRKTGKNLHSELSFMVEEKIDGVSIVLYYERGLLARAVTRGNGLRGNDVTENVRTIRSVPLRLPEPRSVAVRGEIYLPLDRFQEINSTLETPYANPRNLAAGSLRRIKSSAVAGIPLTIFCYEGFFEEAPSSHIEILSLLSRLGFRLNPNVGVFAEKGIDGAALPKQIAKSWTTGDFAAMESFVRARTAARRKLSYEIDGLVAKVNELPARERLGYTGHHPRWAIAFKFEAPEGVTEVRAIDVQVGRTGRITPVARVNPVSVGGTTISNVTLHNQDYIDLLELAVGDTVAISRRGDVIPAVERVIEKNEQNTTWRMPGECPVCGTGLSVIGAHHFCPNRMCPAQVRGRLLFFTARGQMDIDNLGPETIDVLIDRKMVADVADIYTCNYDELLEVPGFGEKKVALIKEGVERSKGQPFKIVLQSLGLPELGQKVSELLIGAGFRSIDEILACVDRREVERLTDIAGIGEKTAETLMEELARPEVRALIQRLRRSGLSFEAAEAEEAPSEEQTFAGQTWCVTGSFVHFKPREKAMDEVKRRGGKVVTSVTGKTTHLLAGEGGGSKLDKAREVGARIVDEQEFLKMLAGTHGNENEGAQR